MLCDFQGYITKDHEASTSVTRMLALGTLSCNVRSLTTLRSPCCEEAQAIWKQSNQPSQLNTVFATYQPRPKIYELRSLQRILAPSYLGSPS